MGCGSRLKCCDDHIRKQDFVVIFPKPKIAFNALHYKNVKDSVILKLNKKRKYSI